MFGEHYKQNNVKFITIQFINVRERMRDTRGREKEREIFKF
jgi:hypothetical protein